MSIVSGYMVMGEDGKEYGPATAEEIRHWVAEGRMDRKTPVKHTEARDWIFLRDVAEFKDMFAPPPLPPEKKPAARREVLIFCAFAVVMVGIYLFIKYLGHH